MKKGLLIWGLILTAAVWLFAPPAGADLIPSSGPEGKSGYWRKRVGISEFPFLKIGQGARAEAMGGAFTSVADDVNATFWNPAGLAHIEHVAYTANYTRWLAGSKLFSGALAFNTGFGVIGFSAVSAAAQEFEVTTPTAPWGTGEKAQVGDIAIGFLFAKKMTDKFMMGGQVRWMQENLYLEKVSNIDYSVGTYFYTGFKSARVGMGFRNLGPDVKVTEGGLSSTMPTIFSVGGAMEVLGKKGGPAYVTLSAEHSFITDYAPVNRFGAEFWIQNTLALRAGYRTNVELENWSGGLGLKYKIKGSAFTLDVSYHNETQGFFASPIRFSVGGSF